jgi:hypothetical protein
MSEDQKERQITLGKIIAYPFGILFVLTGIGTFVDSPIAGVLFLLAGLVALPITRGKLKQEQNISLSRMATIAIVIGLIFAGGLAVDANESTSSPSTSDVGGAETANPSDNDGGGQQTELIEDSPENLLPTIEDFDSDWATGAGDSPENETSFFNTQTETTIIFQVDVYDSIPRAKQQVESRRQNLTEQGQGTEDVNIGQNGFMYKEGDIIQIYFRERNVIAHHEFWAGSGVLTPESNAKDFARLLHGKITG